MKVARTLFQEEVADLDERERQLGLLWRSRGTKSLRIGGRSDYDIDRLGGYGEYGTCYLLGIPFNWSISEPDGDIDGYFRGQTLQIKSTPTGNRFLVFYNLNHFKADIAILTLVDDETKTIEMVGWITREQFLERHTIDRLKKPNGPLQPMVHRDQLNPMDQLVAVSGLR